jgi:hypothetical protein
LQLGDYFYEVRATEVTDLGYIGQQTPGTRVVSIVVTMLVTRMAHAVVHGVVKYRDQRRHARSGAIKGDQRAIRR